VVSTLSRGAVASHLDGVRLISLRMNRDERGHVTELFGIDWAETAGFVPVQWHMLVSSAGTLRGMHLHARHDDLKIVVGGRVALALYDLRHGSSTEGRSQVLPLSAEEYTAVLIPAGVAHGILSRTDSSVLVGVTEAYDGTDEYQCAWNDPGLGIEWPEVPRILSDRDRTAASLADLAETIRAFQPL
jgi:dTDP-4-dehydrorhamnose 3,5-epimerase